MKLLDILSILTNKKRISDEIDNFLRVDDQLIDMFRSNFNLTESDENIEVKIFRIFQYLEDRDI